MNFEVPLADLYLLDLHARTMHALDACENSGGSSLYDEFNQLKDVQFWKSAFDVYYDGELIGVCEEGWENCVVNLEPASRDTD